MKNVINPIYLEADKIQQLKNDFGTAKPFNYVVLPNFLTEKIATTLYDNFPKLDTLNVKRKSIHQNKSEDYHFDRFHPAFTTIKDALANPKFIKIVETITGVNGLTISNDALGAGVQQSENGSYVDVHIDSNYNPKENLWRRLNLLVYLNKNWKPEYGGDLELWDQKMTKCETTIPCDWNRAVIFLTNETTPHGYQKINIPKHETRKSFYTFYSTNTEKGFKYVDAYFKIHPSDKLGKKIVTAIKEPLKVTIKRLLNKMGVTSLDFQDNNKKKL